MFRPFNAQAARLIALLIIGLVIHFTAANAVTPHTITIDGTNDFASDEDIGGTSGTTWYFTWDSTNLYIGLTAGDVDDNNANKWLIVYIDSDPQQVPTAGTGTQTGILYNTQQPGLPFTANYHFRWRSNNSFTSLEQYTGSWGNVTWGGSAFQSGTYFEASIPWSSLGNPDQIHLVGCMINEQPFNEYTYFMVPNTNVEGYDANFSEYYGFICRDGGTAISGLNPDNLGNYSNYVTASKGSASFATASNWVGGVVPDGNTHAYVLGSHTVSIGAEARVDSLTINNGGELQLNAQTLYIDDGNIEVKTGGTLNAGTGVVRFDGNHPGDNLEVRGSISFYDVIVDEGDVDFLANQTVTNSLTMNPGGQISMPCTYADGSTYYHQAQSPSFSRYGANGDWVAGAVGGAPGQPYHVVIRNNSAYDFGSDTMLHSCRGDFTVENGSEIVLSSASGGDLRANGNVNVHGQLFTNNRALFCAGAGKTLYTTDTVTLDYLRIQSNASYTLAGNITIDDDLEILTTGTLSAADKNITFVGPASFTPNGTFNPGTSIIIANASGGIVSINPAVSVYGMNISGGGVNIGSELTIEGYLLLYSGAFFDGSNSPTYADGSYLHYLTNYNLSNEWKPNLISGPAVPFNVVVDNNATVLINSADSYTVRGYVFVNTGSTFGHNSISGWTLNVGGWLTFFGDGDLSQGSVNFNGAQMQLIENFSGSNIAFNNLTVGPGTTLWEDIGLSDGFTVTGTLVNNGIIQAYQGLDASGGNYAMGFTGVGINISGSFAVEPLVVDRIDSNHPNAGPAEQTGKYWSISTTAPTYTADVTLPHSGLASPYVSKHLGGGVWDPARTSFDGTTVTRTGVTSFSDWTVSEPPTSQHDWSAHE